MPCGGVFFGMLHACTPPAEAVRCRCSAHCRSATTGVNVGHAITVCERSGLLLMMPCTRPGGLAPDQSFNHVRLWDQARGLCRAAFHCIRGASTLAHLRADHWGTALDSEAARGSTRIGGDLASNAPLVGAVDMPGLHMPTRLVACGCHVATRNAFVEAPAPGALMRSDHWFL